MEGSTLDIYRVGAELGRGGMGTVFRAESVEDGPAGPAGTVVAIKLFHPQLVENESAFSRFKLEAEIGKRIRHEHVVRTYDVGFQEIDGEAHHYLVMEFIEGQTLQGLLEELGTLPLSLLVQVADQVLDALAAIHEHGIVHRDIKPENIVITPDHRVLLMDLGVARLQQEGRALTRAGEFVGSVHYASPEQFTGTDEVGPRADIYAFGVVLFELTTGTNPFAGDNLTAILQKKLQEEVPEARSVLPDLDLFLNEIIATCLRKETSERFGSAAELRAILVEGERSEWWRQRSSGRVVPSAERALKRLRIERDAPLVGRDAALAELRRHQEAAFAGGRALLLKGATGAGKSRLLYEYLERLGAAGGPAIGAGRGLGAGGRAYQPFAEAMADLLAIEETPVDGRRAALETRLLDLVPDTPGFVPHFASFLLGGLLPGSESGFSKDALLNAYAKVLRRLAGERPVVVAIEDLQLAGEETLELFDYLVRALDGPPVLLIGVYPEDELDEGSELHALTTKVGAHQTVAPLTYADTEELVKAMVALPRTARALARPLFDKSDGNPFLVLEIVAHLKAGGALQRTDEGFELTGSVDEAAVPSTVRDMVALKLGRLDEDQRETLEAAAVLGNEFDASLLAAVLEEKRIKLLKKLAVLERKYRLLASTGKSSFRFASRQLHETTYEEITPALREEYHALVADTMLEEYEDEAPEGEPSYQLLRHLLLAERADEAEPFLEHALDYMAKSFHASYAAPFLEKVVGALQEMAPAERIDLALKLWGFYELLGKRADQLRVLEDARAVADTSGDPASRAQVHGCLGASYWYAGDFDRAGEEAELGLALAREGGDRKWEANCLQLIGVVAWRRGDLARVADIWRQALAIRRDIDDRRGIASALQALALVMPQIGEADAVLETMQEAQAVWHDLGERRGEGAIQLNVGNYLVDAGRAEEGLINLEEAAETLREVGDFVMEATALCNLGRAHHIQGQIDEACEAFERALSIFVDLGNPNGELAVRTMYGTALAGYGDRTAGRSHLEAAVELAERIGQKAKLSMALRDLGDLLHASGKREEGWQHLRRALALENEIQSTSERSFTLGMLGNAALREEDYALAETHLAEGLEGARKAGSSVAARHLCRYARALKGLGRLEEAQAIAREADALVREEGTIAPLYGPEIYFSLREVLGDDAYLASARDLIAERKTAIRNDAHREHFLTRTWPNPEILEEAKRVLDS